MCKDLNQSNAVMEKALGEASFLRESQRRNARLKADDLSQRRIEWESVPFRLMVEFNRRCNGNCLHCDIEREGTGELDFAVFEKVIDETGWGTMEVMPFVGGEPTLAPMERIAPLARKHNNYLNFITNGHLFTREYFESISDITGRVHFSFHSHRKEIGRYIAPDLDHASIVRNIRDAVRIAEGTGAQIVAGIVVMNCNLKDLADYVRFIADLGVRRVIFQKLYPDSRISVTEDVTRYHKNGDIRGHLCEALEAAIERGVYLETNLEEIFGDPRNLPRVKSPFDILQDNAFVVELFQPGFCISSAITVLIEWDGTMIPCCRDRIVLGNLFENSFMEIWNGERMKRLRETFFNRTLQPFCEQCMDFYCGHA